LNGQEKPILAGFCTMTTVSLQKQKAERAFRACMVLLDTAEWMKSELRGLLELFDLAMREFRLLELLYREGALPLRQVAGKQRSQRTNMRKLVMRLGKRGWVRQMIVVLPPLEFERSYLAKSEGDKPRNGRRIGVIGLTKTGKTFMRRAVRRYAKLVKAFMLALYAREQESLVRICEKLREGDVVKLVREIRMEDLED
jgi:DNA-binding MarR family transcriptional regulator